jgi:hypothetical protein
MDGNQLFMPGFILQGFLFIECVDLVLHDEIYLIIIVVLLSDKLIAPFENVPGKISRPRMHAISIKASTVAAHSYNFNNLIWCSLHSSTAPLFDQSPGSGISRNGP